MKTEQKKLLFRPHRGSLAEAMAEVKELPATKTALLTHIKAEWAGWANLVDFEISYYTEDSRIGWSTWIVVGIFSDLAEKPVVGFTNGNVEG